MLFAAVRTRQQTSWRLVLLAAGGALVAVYAAGQVWPASVSSFSLFRSVLLALDYLALPWIRAYPPAGPPLGGAMLAAAVWAVLRKGRPEAPRHERIAVQLILFSLITAAMAALGRADQTAPSDVPLRYAPLLTPMHLGLLLLGLPMLARVSQRQVEVWALGLAAVLLVHQIAAGRYVVRTGDIILQTVSGFFSGRLDPERQGIISARPDEARTIRARLRSDGLYQRELHVRGGERH
jgi:hypothetical protein